MQRWKEVNCVIDEHPYFAEGYFEEPLQGSYLVVTTITSGCYNWEVKHQGEANVIQEPYTAHRIQRRIYLKIMGDQGFLLTDLLMDSEVLKEWLAVLPNVTD